MGTGVLDPRRGLAPDGPSPPGRTAVQRWVDQDPCFEGAYSAHDVLNMCREGAAECWPVLRRCCGWPPATSSPSRRCCRYCSQGYYLRRRACAKATRTWRGWVDEDELEHEVVVIAFRTDLCLGGYHASLAGENPAG
ncbi:MAG TPA: hypothetical protein VK988_02185 [Acidimicrobiales bacterium]|nr:hypothetical protein [Acidimicrobiales bacterium]